MIGSSDSKESRGAVGIFGIILGWVIMLAGLFLIGYFVEVFAAGVVVTLAAAFFGYFWQSASSVRGVGSPREAYKLRANCGFCGKPMRAEMQFCPNCGNRQIMPS